jgi:dTDP-4-dehydrorhamnose reductase
MMRVLITGAAGQLGTELALLCEQSGDEVHTATSQQLDVTDRELTLQVLGAIRPEVVLHCGAWTNVDSCETDPTRAYLVNSLGSRHLAEAADLVGSRVVSVSTDYVFDGRGSGPNGGGAYTEWDATGPISHYGRSKLGGENEMIAVLGRNATIVRTSWVCGAYGNNFVKTMLRLARDPEGKPVTVVDDQRGCPTFTNDLAKTMRSLAVSRLPGLFHITNEGAVSWCEFARAIFTAAGCDASRVLPISTAELLPARPAARPAFSILDNAALRGSGLTAMPHWSAALDATIRALS